MRAFLLFLSSLLTIACCGQTVVEAADSVPVCTAAPAPLDPARCSVLIENNNGAVTGLLLTRWDDRYIYGTVVNEFGISALDFKYDRRKDKVKLEHVVSFLNKWYIKLVLRNDLKLCMHLLFDIPYKGNSNYVVENSQHFKKITNKKRKISYTFTTLSNQSSDEAAE